MSERPSQEGEFATVAHIFPMSTRAAGKFGDYCTINPEPEERRIDMLAGCMDHDLTLAEAMQRSVTVWDITQEYQEHFIDGFMIAQKLMQLQGEEHNVTLPLVNKNSMEAYFQQLAQGDLSIDEWLRQKMRQSEGDDMVFSVTIGQYLKENASQLKPLEIYGILLGAATSYDFSKYQLEARDFAMAFSL